MPFVYSSVHMSMCLSMYMLLFSHSFGCFQCTYAWGILVGALKSSWSLYCTIKCLSIAGGPSRVAGGILILKSPQLPRLTWAYLGYVQLNRHQKPSLIGCISTPQNALKIRELRPPG